MLALTLASLLRRELHHKGIDLSIPTLLDELSEIHEVALLYPAEAGVKNQLALSEMSPIQQKLYEALELAKYRRLRYYKARR